MKNIYNFAVIGVGGYIAPKHLQAIKDTGNKIVATLDIHNSVGILDRFAYDIKFFTKFERFDRYIDKIKTSEREKIDFISICSPNYLHDYHIKFALRNGASAICEKPLVLNPWNLERLIKLESEYGKKIFTVLQLRLHPLIVSLRERILNSNNSQKHEIFLTYITPRGPWYLQSWKGNISKSGGIASNIGIHFFDMLIWIFGSVVNSEVHLSEPKKMAGFLELKNANVRWYLSIDSDDVNSDLKSIREIIVDGEKIDFSNGFTGLHTKVYENILEGKGFGLNDAKPSIDLAYKIRNSEITQNFAKFHPSLAKILPRMNLTNLKLDNHIENQNLKNSFIDYSPKMILKEKKKNLSSDKSAAY